MQIRYFATIRDITGVKEVRREAPAETLGDLLRDLCAQYGPSFRRWVLDGDDLGPAIIVLVNGRDARHLEGIKTVLKRDDIISLFPMVAGG
jgi:molybdopterin synthase sulfur carrier subunit